MMGVQFLGLEYYYPSTEKIDWSTQFGAVGYIITLYSSKSYVKTWEVRPNFGGLNPPNSQWLHPCPTLVLGLSGNNNLTNSRL